MARVAVEPPSTRGTAADAETPLRGTKAPVIVEKQSPPAALQQDSAPTALSTGGGGKNPAKGAADSPDATRLLSAEQLASAFSRPRKDRTDADAASMPAAQPRHDPAPSRENDWPRFREPLPRVAGHDESTQYLRLSIPERGPIRGEPAPADDAGQTQESPGHAVPGSISWNLDGWQAPRIPSDSAERDAHSDTGKLGAAWEDEPAPRLAPQATQGKLHALVPVLLILNLGLTLLTLANTYFVLRALAR